MSRKTCKTKSVKSSEREQNTPLLLLIATIGNNLNQLFRWGGIVACVYFGGKYWITPLAGKTTLADIVIGLSTPEKVSYWANVVFLIIGLLGVAYGGRQRKLRRNTVSRLQTRNQELEKMLDQGRTSSELTPRGETRPEDM
jgi:hypothetical protein